jgi:hypothetical protein
MRGRFEIRETTRYLQSSVGWQEVTITDTVTGLQVKGLGKTYEDAVAQAWLRLKQLQGTPPGVERAA